jgi:prepilin-type N-terminal cleavage/methylation domain-containing protein
MKNIELRHSGFTLVELLIVIAIIGTLMALLLPAVNMARERGRQAQCTNRLAELGKGMVNHATSGKGKFPGWMQLQKLSPTAADRYRPTPERDVEVSWAAKLLPRLDRRDLWDSLLMGNLNLSTNLVTIPDDIPQLDIFLCPSDVRTNPKDPALTYVVNSGAPDVTPNPPNLPQSDYAANGICHNLVPNINSPNAKKPSVSLDGIQDGTAKTLLLSENIDKDETDPSASTPNSSWLRSSAIALSPSQAEQPFGMVWVADGDINQQLAPRNTAQERINRDVRTNAELGNSFVSLGTTLGARFARPHSAHPEIFIVVFAGGNTQSINENIDYRVYQQMLTPNGAKCVWPSDPSIELNTAFRNVPPLSDADY